MRSANPEDFESSLPVHQDGSCNGLQHYAALGGDVDGGREVNLIAGDRPGDVYSKVAAEVNKVVDQDASTGHELALAVQGKISRKVVKQTVSRFLTADTPAMAEAQSPAGDDHRIW